MKKLFLSACIFCLPLNSSYAAPAPQGTESLVNALLVAAIYDPKPPRITQLSLQQQSNGACMPSFVASCPDGYMLPNGALKANFNGRKVADCSGMNPAAAQENALQFLNVQGVYCIKAS